MLEYAIPLKGLFLSEVFSKLEILRATGTIFDYSIIQTTLDQVGVYSYLVAENVTLCGALPVHVRKNLVQECQFTRGPLPVREIPFNYSELYLRLKVYVSEIQSF